MGDVRTESNEEIADCANRRIALAITLLPIAIALLISIALGSPPWRARKAPEPDTRPVGSAAAAAHPHQ